MSPPKTLFCPVKYDDGVWKCPTCEWRSRPGEFGPEERPYHNCGRVPGVGTELKRLLLRFFIRDDGSCGCDQKAVLMNDQGPDWCEENVDVIVGWLRDAAKSRKLPFVDVAGRVLVRRAIKNARRKQEIMSRD